MKLYDYPDCPFAQKVRVVLAEKELEYETVFVDLRTGELWGNFPQTYSMVGIINGAVRLSAPWDSAV